MTKTDPTRRRRIQPGIYKKANGRFIVRFRDGDRVRDRTFETLADARRFKIAREAGRDREQADGIHLDDDTVERLADAIARRLEANR